MSDEMKTMEATVDTKETEMPVLVLPGEEETQLDQMMVEASAQPETVKEVNIEVKIRADRRGRKKAVATISRQRSISATRTISCSTARTRRRRLPSSQTWHWKKSERRTSALSAIPSAA